jgi:DNA-binding NarL/FixJ family response regulator
MTAARVLLCDDHDLFRQGLAGLIEAQPDLSVAGQAADGLEALALARDLHPDLIVIDIKMPVCDGLEATRLIRAELPDARIVILTVHDEDEKLFEAIKAGAIGYVLKDVNAADFLPVVRGALAGAAALPPKMAARLLDEFARLARRAPPESSQADSPDLTPREHDVLNLIATGATDKEIASELSLSLHTVKSHVRSILNKLHVANRRDAATLAARRGHVRGDKRNLD